MAAVSMCASTVPAAVTIACVILVLRFTVIEKNAGVSCRNESDDF